MFKHGDVVLVTSGTYKEAIGIIRMIAPDNNDRKKSVYWVDLYSTDYPGRAIYDRRSDKVYLAERRLKKIDPPDYSLNKTYAGLKISRDFFNGIYIGGPRRKENEI